MAKRFFEFIVGLFIIAGFAALLVLAFWVSGLTNMKSSNYYKLDAEFDNVGGLKVRAPVSLAGVAIGRVESISLDPKSFRADVHLLIDKHYNNLPIDTSASIFTQGILGANYISLLPGFETKNLKPGGELETTHSALILENLIGQLLFNVKGDKKEDKTDGDSNEKK
ncbi:MAG: outer membrane lipid asymmetry maintenance protein MlaD [Gammaproteobacteria bacterium]|nr:outer membrane lipid asymmetry maintenance protein MlaD [Gammaproteobacteria bacterium]